MLTKVWFVKSIDIKEWIDHGFINKIEVSVPEMFVATSVAASQVLLSRPGVTQQIFLHVIDGCEVLRYSSAVAVLRVSLVYPSTLTIRQSPVVRCTRCTRRPHI